MGNFLVRLGQKTYQHRWRVLIVWVIALALLGVGAKQFMKPLDGAITIPGTQAQKTLDRYNQLFSNTGKGSGTVVIAIHGGQTVDDYQSQITALTHGIAKVPGVTSAVSPFVNTAAISKDRTIAYIPVSLQGEQGSVSSSTFKGVNNVINTYNKGNMEIEQGGGLINQNPGNILGIGEVSGVVLALLVLLITLGSLIAAGMPIIVALFAIGVSMGGLFSLSQVVDINSTTPALAVMLGLAVGIDYSLFIISRYKTLLLEGNDYKTAIGRAIATAGNAVLFAATTVLIALAALSIVQIPFITVMGLSAAAAVAVTAIAAVTLLPALLGFAGTHIFMGKTRRRIAEAQSQGAHHTEHVLHTTFWYKWGQTLTRHPMWVLIITVVVIATIAVPATQLKLGLPIDEYAAKTSTQRKAYDLITKGFGVGTNAPLLVLVQHMPTVTSTDKAAVRTQLMDAYNQQVAAATAKQKAAFEQALTQAPDYQAQLAVQQQIAAAEVQAAKQQQKAVAQINQEVDTYAPYYQLSQIATRLAKVSDVSKASAIQVTKDGTNGVIQITPKSGPSDQATITLITYLRNAHHQKSLTGSDSTSLEVTGTTAIQYDINNKLDDALPVYLAVVVGLSFILLLIAFRSILVPLKATLGFLLSVSAMFGGLVAVFQWGWFGVAEAPGPIISFIPIIGIGILFGLAMDYEFFLVSGMHEAHQHTGDPHKAVMRGFSQGSKVVTAAAFIMVSVFAGFISNGEGTIQSLGFGLALGIFIDAFLVRMTIVPVVMTLFGHAAWWLPKWLDRILPHVSIEGDEGQPKKQSKQKSL